MRVSILLPLAAALAVLQAQDRPDLPTPPASADASANPMAGSPRLVSTQAKILDMGRLSGPVKASLQGMGRTPKASGDAWIHPRGEATRVLARVKDLPPASDLGGDALTYVLWSISPAGKATNLGEVTPTRGRARIEAMVDAQAFGLVVTAEPYFAVSRPGDMPVLALAQVHGHDAPGSLAEASYDQVSRPPLALAEGQVPGGDPKASLTLREARNAVRIARAAGAPEHAGTAFGRAESLLAEAEGSKGSHRQRLMTAREAVRIAEDARDAACQRQEAIRIAQERRNAEQKLEEARLAEARAAEADAKARMQVAKAKAEAGQAKAEAGQAQAEAGQAMAEAGQLRSRLRDQLNAVLQTRETAKGLIVSMSGVHFQTGKSTLTREAREKLAKIAGILAAHRGLRIEAEGHTDSTGSEAFNRVLSEKRAEATRAYLVSQGVSPDAISFRGFGKASPVATNDTPEGRQENRRVELVVTGAGLGKP